MLGTAQLGPERGTFAHIRHFYCRAAMYDMAYARTADDLDRKERHVRRSVTAITAVTSLSLFGSFFVDNPATWAKAVVFALAATTSILTAWRNDARWLHRSHQMRLQGVQWARQWCDAEKLAAKIMNGEHVTDEEQRTMEETDQRLLLSNPALTHELVDECKDEETAEFDAVFTLEA